MALEKSSTIEKKSKTKTIICVILVNILLITIVFISYQYQGFTSELRLGVQDKGNTVTETDYSDTCSNLLDDGYYNNVTWQPYGCNMHNYTVRELYTCFSLNEMKNKTSLVFLGDSRMHFLFVQLRGFVERDVHYNNWYEFPKEVKVFTINKTTFSYTWHERIDASMIYYYNKWADPAVAKPGLLLTDSCLHHINHDVDDTDQVRATLKRLIPLFDNLINSTKHLWMIQGPIADTYLCNNQTGNAFFCDYMVDKFNKIFIDILSNVSSVRLWHTYRTIYKTFIEKNDGLHVVYGKAMEYHIQIVWNYYCNDVMDLPEGTCCSKSKPKPTQKQILHWIVQDRSWRRFFRRAAEPILISLFVSLLLLGGVFARRYLKDKRRSNAKDIVVKRDNNDTAGLLSNLIERIYA